MRFYIPIFRIGSGCHGTFPPDGRKKLHLRPLFFMYPADRKTFFFIIEVPKPLIAQQKLCMQMEMRMFEGDFSLPR